MKILLGIWYLFVLLLGVVGLIGWVWNVIKLFSTHDFLPFVARLVGVIIPIVGAILGWF